jgi:hypothetical protein
MDEVRHFTDRIAAKVPLKVEKLADYPEYFYWEPHLHFRKDWFSAGIIYSFSSTGSRYSIKDFTGEYLLDTRLKGYSYGADVRFYFNPANRLQICFYTELGWVKTKMVYEDLLEVDSRRLFDNTYILRAGNLYTEPGLELSFHFSWVALFINAGFCKQFGGEDLHGWDDGEKFEISYHLGNVKVGWTGYRLGIGLDLNLTEIVNM